MAICVWCGFDRLEASAEVCGVCGQAPDAGTVTLEAKTEYGGTPTAVKAADAPSVARVFGEHYEIEAPIGRGGMGSVFRVTDRRDGKTYALKILHASAADTSTLKRFEREAAVLRRIAHEAVPKIRGYGVAGGSMYLVTEFVDGTNLRDAIADGGAFPLGEIVRIGASIADCLNAAHTHGVIHRDIKPHNVMLTRERHVRLIDFGIARDAAVNATVITATDVMLGTPQYMSPEQFDGRRTDARSDIYSLGVVLFQLATGRLPFHAETPTALALKHVSEAPPHPRAIRPDIPMLLDRVILKCLEKNPADRYPTAGDLATDLRRTLDARRSVQRTRIGDFVVHEETGDDWALVLASPRERAWPPGMTLFFNDAYFRLARVDYDETYPAPFVYRFTFFPETEAIRRFVDYESEAAATPAPQKSGLAKLFKRTPSS